MKPLCELVDILARKHRVFRDIKQSRTRCSDCHNGSHLCREDVESARKVFNTRLRRCHSRCDASTERARENRALLETMIQFPYLGFGLRDGTLLTQEIALRSAIGCAVHAVILLGRL